MYIKDYDEGTFSEIIRDFIADGAPEYDDLEIEDPEIVDGHWEARASDATTTYTLTDDGTGNIVINYSATK